MKTRPGGTMHGDHVFNDDSAEYFCRVHGWVPVQRLNSAIYFTNHHNAKTGCLPVLDTVTATVDLMRALVAAGRPWVAVFWDCGWGDNGQPVEISVIEDGNGQNPRALITPEVYAELLHTEMIRPNSLQTFKARRVHDFAEQATSLV